MVSKPSVYPTWASLDQVDNISGSNNVLTPPTSKQLYGWDRLEFPPRNWFNWLGRYTNAWLLWLSQQEAQAIVTSDATGATPIVDTINGGMALIYVIDTGTSANFFEGITYLPPAYSGGTSFTTVASNSSLTIGAISATGGVTVSGGSGNFIIYGQMKTIP